MKNVLKTIVILALAFVLLLAGQLMGEFVKKLFYMSEHEGIQFAGMYVSFIGVWVVFVLFCLIIKPFREKFPKLGRKEPGNNIKTALLIGLPFGIGINLLVAIVAMLNKDIALTYSGFNFIMILLFLVSIAIQSGAEELVARWFIYENVYSCYPKYPIIAVILNALFFGAVHLANQGVTVLGTVNLILTGFLYGLIVYYFKSFWAVVVAHTTWNFCQNILLGLPNSGIVTQYSIFSLDAANARDSFAYSVSFGIEGSILSVSLLTIACVVVILIGRKKKMKLINAE